MTRVRGLLERWEFPYWILGALGALTPAVGYMAWAITAEAHRENPPSCYGLGFGCTLDPILSGIVAAFIYGMWVAGAAGVVALTELLPEPERFAAVRIVRSILALGAAAYGIRWILRTFL